MITNFLFNKGTRCYDKREYVKAIRFFEFSLWFSKNDYFIWLYKGLSHYYYADQSTALKALQKNTILKGLAESKEIANQSKTDIDKHYISSEKCFSKALSIDPGSSIACFFKGMTIMEQSHLFGQYPDSFNYGKTLLEKGKEFGQKKFPMKYLDLISRVQIDLKDIAKSN